MLNADATAELHRVARRMVWFEPPEEALADSASFLSYAMSFGAVDDLRVVRAHYTDDELRQALRSGLRVSSTVGRGRTGMRGWASSRCRAFRQTPVVHAVAREYGPASVERGFTAAGRE